MGCDAVSYGRYFQSTYREHEGSISSERLVNFYRPSSITSHKITAFTAISAPQRFNIILASIFIPFNHTILVFIYNFFLLVLIFFLYLLLLFNSFLLHIHLRFLTLLDSQVYQFINYHSYVFLVALHVWQYRNTHKL